MRYYPFTEDNWMIEHELASLMRVSQSDELFHPLKSHVQAGINRLV